MPYFYSTIESNNGKLFFGAQPLSLNKDRARNFLQAINCLHFEAQWFRFDRPFVGSFPSSAHIDRVQGPHCAGALVCTVTYWWLTEVHPCGEQKGGTVARVGKRGSTGFPNSWKFVKLPWPIGEHLIEDKWPWFFHHGRSPPNKNNCSTPWKESYR